MQRVFFFTRVGYKPHNDIHSPRYQKGTIMAKTEKQNEQEPTVVIVSDHPTTKQQLTSAAIQVGAALAVPIVIAGSLAVCSKVGSVRTKIREARAAKQLDSTTEPISSTE